MGLEGGHGGGPAVVGHAEHADTAVVGSDVGEQPLDRVVGVGPFVEGVHIARRSRRTLHLELALGLRLAADVLEDEEIAVLGQSLQVGGEVPLRLVDAVWRAEQDERQRLGLMGGHEDLRVQLDPVAHGDHRVADLEGFGTNGSRLGTPETRR